MTMLSTYSLEEAIVVARDTYVKISRPRRPVPIDPILRYAEKVESAARGQPYSIKTMIVDVEKNEYRGIFARGLSSSTIYLSHELNDCWKRFVICKEAIHLLVDDSDLRYAKSVRDQTMEAFQMFWPTQSRAPLTSEVFASVVAFEILYPWESRRAISKPPEDMHQEAVDFKIPEHHLDAYFRCTFGILSEEINSGILVP